MPLDVPEDDAAWGLLLPGQEAALERLMLGEPASRIAEAIGVDRKTISRWKLRDAVFIAEWNRRRQEVREHARQRLLNIAGKAADVVCEAVTNGDVPTALRLLKGLGLIDGEHEPAETHAETIAGHLYGRDTLARLNLPAGVRSSVFP